MLYRFGDYHLDPRRYELRQAGQPLKIEPKVFDVLVYLLQHRDRVISKDEVLAHVWPQQFISEATLNSCIMATRKAVGDSGRNQQVIQTVYGRGYRFIAAVEEIADQDGRQPEPRHCPVCQHVISPGATFCAACGHPLADDGPGPASEQPPVLLSRPTPLSDIRLCTTCQHANRDDATFCAACGTRLRQHCPHCGQDVPLPATFCPACGQSLAAASPRAATSAAAGELSLSDTVPTPPDQGSLRAERKPVIVLCCTVATTAEGRTPFDLDTLHSLLQALRTLARDVVQPYGGRLSPVMGDHLLIMFGVPVAQEDDARRAVQVALDLRQRVSTHQERSGTAYQGGLTLRMGLHTGLVVVEGGQDDAETDPPVVGDVISLALALQAQAAPGQILCSDATARLVQGAVSLVAVGPAQLPGQPTPVHAYAVLGSNSRRASGGQRLGRVLSPFVDREREMETLHALLAQAEAGRGQMVGVVGEAGLGKSRLLAEFRRSLGERRLTYLTGRCLSYGSMTPYLPVLELLRHHCGITETDRPEDTTVKIHRSLQEVEMAPEDWAPPLLHLLDIQEGTQPFLALSPEARKAQTLTALTQMCLHGSRQRPLILEVEDLHWLDASSDEWLTALVEQMMGVPLLVLVTYRPGYRPAWIDKSYATQVALQPLTPQESLLVVQAVLPTAVPTAPLVPHLLATGEGNPFFLEELAQTVVEQGAEASAPTVPDTVQAVLLACIDRLPASAKRLLQAAAAIGKDVAVPLLQAIIDVPDEAISRDLRHLQTAEFLYAAHTQTTLVYTFKHVLTQEVTYQALLRRTRQQYHARIAQVLEAQFPEVAETQPELLAQHYTRGDQGVQAILYWQRAGQRAVERSANVEAISHFTQGLEVLKGLPKTPEHTQYELVLHLALGAPLAMLKGYIASEVEHVYAQAYALCQQVGDSAQRLAALDGLCVSYIARGSFQTARELAEQGLTLAQREGDLILLREAHMMLGTALFHMGELVSARVHVEQSMVLWDTEPRHTLVLTGANHPMVHNLSIASWTLWLLGYPEQALARSVEACTRAQEASHAYSQAFALTYASAFHQYRREPRRAQEYAEAVLALAREQGFIRWSALGTIYLGWALAAQSAVQEGIQHLRQGLAAWRAMGGKLSMPILLVRLAEAYGQGEQAVEGLRALDEALAFIRNSGERVYEAEVHRLKGELLLQSGGWSLGEVEACFRQALDVARHQQAKSLELRAAMSLARLWQAQGKGPEAYQTLMGIYGWFTEGFDTLDLQEAKALIEALQGPAMHGQ